MGRKMKRAFRRLIPPNASFNPYVTMKVFHFLPKAKKKKSIGREPCFTLALTS